MSPPGPTISARRRNFLSLIPLTSTRDAEPADIGAGPRTLAIALALLITAGLLVVLLSFQLGGQADHRDEVVTVVRLEAAGDSAESPEPDAPESAPAETAPTPQPAETEPEPETPTLPPPPIPQPAAAAPPPPSEQPPAPRRPRAVLRPSNGQVYGPPGSGGASSGDTEQVGTAPNGEPLYAAAWYREPSDDELRGYLSTASGPGWGLIACRTAPEYRVEDCVGLDEYPTGSQITRAILAAAWQFRVRPPRRGGRPMVGSWVRIRIDYATGRR